MMQLYIAINTEGFGRTSIPIQDMIKTMKEILEAPSNEFLEAIDAERDAARTQRNRQYIAPLVNTDAGNVDPLIPTLPPGPPNSNTRVRSPNNIPVYRPANTNTGPTNKYEEEEYTPENLARIGGIPKNYKLGGGSKRKTRRRTTKRTRRMRKSRRHH